MKTTKILTVLSFIFAIIGIVMAFTPFRAFIWYVGGLAIILGIIAFIVNKSSKEKSKAVKKGWIYAPVLIAIIAIGLSYYMAKVNEGKVSEDKQFEQEIKQQDTLSVEDVVGDTSEVEDIFDE